MMWRGRSLAFVRRMAGSTVMHLDANEAMQRSGKLQDGVPPTRTFAWYESAPHGNIAFSLGDGWVLGIDNTGKPRVFDYDSTQLGEYLGWTRQLGTA